MLSYFKIPRSHSLMFMLQLFALLRRIAEPIPFLPPSFTPPQISLFWETSIAITPSGTQKVVLTPDREEVFNWVISSDLLLLNNPNIPTLTRSFSGSLYSPDIFFAPSSFALSCSWEVLQDLGSNHLPILLTVPLSLLFRPNEHHPSFNSQKARWNDILLRLSLSFCRGILVSFSFLCCCSLYFSDTKCGQIFHFFRPHQTPS